MPQPDLVIVSAGFDAHAHDSLEAGALHEVDFAWMTSELVALAEVRRGGAPARGGVCGVREGRCVVGEEGPWR